MIEVFSGVHRLVRVGILTLELLAMPVSSVCACLSVAPEQAAKQIQSARVPALHLIWNERIQTSVLVGTMPSAMTPMTVVGTSLS
jgi:hypothetical protein